MILCKTGRLSQLEMAKIKKKAKNAQHEVHRFGIPKKGKEIVEHDRDDHDLDKRSDGMEKAHSVPFTSITTNLCKIFTR